MKFMQRNHESSQTNYYKSVEIYKIRRLMSIGFSSLGFVSYIYVFPTNIGAEF